MNGGSNSVSVISNGYLAGTFPVSGWPVAAAPAGLNAVWITSSEAPFGSGGYFTKKVLDDFGSTQFYVQHQPAAVVSVPYDGRPEPFLYFVDWNSNGLFMFDPTTGAVFSVSNVWGSAGAQALLFDGTNIWVSNLENTVSKLAPLGAVLGTFSVGSSPLGLAFDGSSIWVANSGDDTVTQLRANDGQTLQTITTGANPTGIAFDGVNIWVTNMGENTLTQIRASDGVVLRNLATGLSPFGVVSDGAHVWVANRDDNTVSRYQP
jgi:YVTN family beta-propeller protein